MQVCVQSSYRHNDGESPEVVAYALLTVRKIGVCQIEKSAGTTETTSGSLPWMKCHPNPTGADKRRGLWVRSPLYLEDSARCLLRSHEYGEQEQASALSDPSPAVRSRDRYTRLALLATSAMRARILADGM